MTSTSRLRDNIQTELRFDVTPTELIESQEPTDVPQTDMTDTSTKMTIVITPQFFEGPIRSTSSYLSKGNFHYGYDENQLRLSLDETYKADTALPGLYVYL